LFFSNIEPYRNRGFRLSIGGFGFSVLLNVTLKVTDN